MKLDRDELMIHNAFSQITVDTQNLERKIMSQMKNNPKYSSPRRKAGFLVAMVAIMVLAAGSVYAAVSIRSFERFVDEHFAPFAYIMDAVEEYDINQDIRIEVLGAQRFDDRAIAYVSLQDISGKNRLTENSNILQEWGVLGQDWDFSSWTVTFELLYVSEVGCTAYFEAQFTPTGALVIGMRDGMDLPESELSDIIEIIIGAIVFDHGVINHPFPLQLTSLTEQPTTYYATWNSDLNRVLTPTMGQGLPELPPPPSVPLGLRNINAEDHSSWLSSVAIIDGYLHVQFGSTHQGPNRMVNLIAPDGTYVFPSGGQEWFSTDEHLQIVNFPVTDLRADGESTQEQLDAFAEEMQRYMDKMHYDFYEMVFPIDISNLENYTLKFVDFYQTGIEGSWKFTIYTDDNSDQVRSWEGSVSVGRTGYFVIETMIISPLGIRTTGGFIYDGRWINLSDVAVETPDGVFYLADPSGWFVPNHEAGYYGEFNVLSRSLAPIDVANVSAVIVDGVRIPLD